MDYVRLLGENRTSFLYFVRTTNILPRPPCLIPQLSVTLYHETTYTHRHSSVPLVNHHRSCPVQHRHAASGTPQGCAPRHAAHKQAYTPYNPHITYRHLHPLQPHNGLPPSHPRRHQPLRLPHRPIHPQACLPQWHRPSCQLRTRLCHYLWRGHPCRSRQSFRPLCHHSPRLHHPQLLPPLPVPRHQRHPRPSRHTHRNHRQQRLPFNRPTPPPDPKGHKKRTSHRPVHYSQSYQAHPLSEKFNLFYQIGMCSKWDYPFVLQSTHNDSWMHIELLGIIPNGISGIVSLSDYLVLFRL